MRQTEGELAIGSDSLTLAAADPNRDGVFDVVTAKLFRKYHQCPSANGDRIIQEP